MSTDPENHPIEPGIAPLVYCLYALGVCRPCWSCEGHLDAGGKLGRIPSVWFHSESSVYPALISDYLYDLPRERKIAHPWRVAMVSSGGLLISTYAIEPYLTHVGEPDLAALRRDVAAIAANLVERVKRLARLTLAEIDTAVEGMVGG